MKEAYIDKRFSRESLRIIDIVDTIVVDYLEQGYRLTVRQLYYQLVAHHGLPNTEESYKRITSLVNDAKLAGLIDWEAIEDRTRAFVRRPHWESGTEILQSAADSYHEDMWATQDHRVFVIVEKEALAGVLERVCNSLDMPLLAARGYPSGTVLREFVEADIIPASDENQRIVILHLGDHDPSGIDMTRDLENRVNIFSRDIAITLRRIALNMPQIDELNPPENPAKSTDARYKDYRAKYGAASWELDALSPQYLTDLVRSHAEEYIDMERWLEAKEAINKVRRHLNDVTQEFADRV